MKVFIIQIISILSFKLTSKNLTVVKFIGGYETSLAHTLEIKKFIIKVVD